MAIQEKEGMFRSSDRWFAALQKALPRVLKRRKDLGWKFGTPPYLDVYVDDVRKAMALLAKLPTALIAIEDRDGFSNVVPLTPELEAGAKKTGAAVCPIAGESVLVSVYTCGKKMDYQTSWISAALELPGLDPVMFHMNLASNPIRVGVRGRKSSQIVLLYPSCREYDDLWPMRRAEMIGRDGAVVMAYKGAILA